MTRKSVDLIMWARNGAHFLPRVLKRIEETIPSRNVNRRILIDDHSSDSTVEIARGFNWETYKNPSSGISAGANEALRHVESPFFISFEQDLLLTKEWWNEIPRHFEKKKVAVVSGMRVAEKPAGLRKLQQYVARKYRGEKELSSWLRSRMMAAFTLGKTLDNTMYKTEVMRNLGGFPKMTVNAGVDAVLAYKMEKAGFHWIVDYNLQSTHIRKNLREELRHQQLYASMLKEISLRIRQETGLAFSITRSSVFFRLAISPATGMLIALRMRDPSITYIHPLVRLAYAKGLLAGHHD
jgi:glycosyltransferase involved in cell wall biosynthesis